MLSDLMTSISIPDSAETKNIEEIQNDNKTQN